MSLKNQHGLLLKHIRERRGFTQKKLSGLSGISIVSISLAETGDTMATCETIFILCKALSIDASLFYTCLWKWSNQEYKTSTEAYAALERYYK